MNAVVWGKLKVIIAHLRLPSSSQKRACLSSLIFSFQFSGKQPSFLASHARQRTPPTSLVFITVSWRYWTSNQTTKKSTQDENWLRLGIVQNMQKHSIRTIKSDLLKPISLQLQLMTMLINNTSRRIHWDHLNTLIKGKNTQQRITLQIENNGADVWSKLSG